MSGTTVTDSPNAPRPADSFVREIADGLRRIENNYHREGSGPGSRFEGRLLEDVQAEWAVREIRTRAEASNAFIIKLDALLLTIALASPQERAILASCLACRNRMLYLLDQPVTAERGLHRRMRARLAATETVHREHADGQDILRPQIRGLL